MSKFNNSESKEELGNDFATVQEMTEDVEDVVALDNDPGFGGDVKEPVMLDKAGVVQRKKVEPVWNAQSILLTELRTKISSDLNEAVADIEGLGELGHLMVAEEIKGEVIENTKCMFDNSKSSIPVHQTGRFNSLKELQDMVNDDASKTENRDVLDDVKAVMKVATVVPACMNLTRKTTIMKDHFRICKTRTTYRLLGPGVHYPRLTNFRWYGDAEPFDLELDQSGRLSNLRRITPNHSILQVGANYIGVARINSHKGTVPADNVTSEPEDGDSVIFLQGKYLLRETEYRDIACVYIDPDETVLDLGGVCTLVRIGPAQVGGALRLETNEFELFKPGRTYILDRKQWTSAIVVDRSPRVFTLGTYIQFLPLGEGRVASISRKDGKNFLIGRPGLYVLKQNNWTFEETFVKENGESYDVGSFVVRTVHPDELAVVRNQWTNECHLLKSGKYYLNKAKWEVEIRKMDRVEVHIKPFTLVQVGENLYVGARNNISGAWCEFHEKYKNKIIVLHESQYSHVVQVPKTSHSLSRFGPYYTILVPVGKTAVYDRKGTITLEGCGAKRLNLDEGLILEPLPTVPQTLRLGDVKFLSSDDYDLAISVTIEFNIMDHVKLSTLLRSRCASSVKGKNGHNAEYVMRNDPELQRLMEKYSDEYEHAWTFSFEDYKQEVRDKAEKILLSRLRSYDSRLLLHNGKEDTRKDIVEQNVLNISQSCCEELQQFLDMTDVGICISKVNLLGGFRFTDAEVIEYFKLRTREAVRCETMEQTQKTNAAKAKAKSVIAVEEAREQSIIATMKLEEQKKHEAIALETQRLKAEQQLANEQLKIQKELENQKQKIEQENLLRIAKERAQAEVDTINVEHQKKQDLLRQEAELVKTQKQAEIVRLKLELDKQKEEQTLRFDMERAKNKMKIKALEMEAECSLLLEKAKAESNRIRELGDAEAYRQSACNKVASERPENLNIEEIMKLMNQSIEHFGQSAWAHPNIMEGMIGLSKNSTSKDGAVNNTTGSASNYQALMTNSIAQAMGIMQTMQLQNNKLTDKENKIKNKKPRKELVPVDESKDN